MNNISTKVSEYRSREPEICVRNGEKNTAFVVAFPSTVTALLLILYLFSSPDFSSAGDANIAELLADGSRVLPGYINLTWPLVWILHPLVRAFPGICWWTFFSIVVMFGSLLAILLSIQRMIPDWRGGILSVLTAGLIWADIYSEPINFTINTALAAVAGFSLLCSLSAQDRRRRKVITILFGILFLGIAGSLRWLEMFLCLPFFLLSLLLRALPEGQGCLRRNRIHADQRSRAAVRLTLMTAGLVILLTAGAWGAGKLTQKLDPWYAENYAGNELLGDISDYADRYPSYEENADAYEAAGITPSWISMVMNSANSDLNYLSSSDMAKMLPFRGKTEMTISKYWGLLKSYPVVWLSVAFILVCGIWLFGFCACLLPFLGETAGFLAAGVFFVHQGRIAWRVTGGMLLAAMTGFLVAAAGIAAEGKARNHAAEQGKAAADSGCRWKNCRLESSEAGIPGWTKAVPFAALLILLITISSGISFSFPRAEITDQAEASDYEYMSSHPENCYFVDNRYYIAHNVWTGMDGTKYSNIIPDVSNFVIGFREQLAERGITDIVSDMLVRSDILMNYNDTWFGYLKDYYDPDVTISIMGKNEETGTAYIAYHRPVDMSDVPQAESTDEVSYPVMYLEAEPFSEQQYNVLNVSGGITEETTGKYSEFALEIQDDGTGNTYTYPMTLSDGSLSVRSVWPDGTWNYSSSHIFILGKESGEETWNILSDLTGQPISFESAQGSEGS